MQRKAGEEWQIRSTFRRNEVTALKSILGAFAKLRKATISFVMSVRPSAWNNTTSTGRILIKFDILVFVENLSRKFKFH
jgi:hypothetical protein